LSKARTERRNWTDTVCTDHWASKAKLLVIGWMRQPTPLDGAYCNALLLAHWSVCQKL